MKFDGKDLIEVLGIVEAHLLYAPIGDIKVDNYDNNRSYDFLELYPIPNEFKDFHVGPN